MADKFFIEKKKEKSGEVHARHNFAWVLGCIVLFLVSLTFVLPATGIGVLFSPQDGIVFGKFANKKIKFSENTYMYSAYQQSRDQMSMFFSSSGNDDFLNRYSMNEGYNSSVTREGVLYFAKKSGALVSADAVNDYIKKNYVDEDGNFYSDGWRSIRAADRKMIRENSRENILAMGYIDALNDVKEPSHSVDFIKGFIPQSKNFDCLVFIGDDAAEKSSKALDELKKGAKLETVAKNYEKTVANVTNVFESSFPLIQNESRAGDAGKFFQALEKTPDLRLDLFALAKDAVYPEVVSLADTEKVIIVARGEASDEQKKENQDSISSVFSTNYEYTLRDLILKSKLHKNNFEKTYDKYFKSK